MILSGEERQSKSQSSHMLVVKEATEGLSPVERLRRRDSRVVRTE